MFRNKDKKVNYSHISRNLVTLTDSQSMISEQFRTIRANIKFSLPEKDLKTLLITSSTPGEGKSTSAANIAIVFAQDGKKVLLIDSDMRRPTLHYTFNLQKSIGLSNILLEQSYITNAIQETPIVGLDIVTSGATPPNPAELLSSKNMDNFLEEVRKKYDLIIFDAPPVLSVSDPQILGNICDGTLIIINSGVSDKRDLIQATNTLKSSKAKILGVIFNNYKIPKGKDYYHY